MRALVKERRTSEMLLAVVLWSAHAYCVCRFWIGFGGSLTATIGPRQAVAVHIGAMGTGSPTPKAARQVSVMFSEITTTTPGEVSTISFRRRAERSNLLYCKSRARISSWLAAYRNSVTGTRPTRYVPVCFGKAAIADNCHVDPAGSSLLPCVGCDGVLTPEHNVPVQVHSQRISRQGTYFPFPSTRPCM